MFIAVEGSTTLPFYLFSNLNLRCMTDDALHVFWVALPFGRGLLLLAWDACKHNLPVMQGRSADWERVEVRRSRI